MLTNNISQAQKILIIGERFYPEEFLINDLADEWTKMGKRVDVLTQNPSYPYGKVYSGYKNKFLRKDIYKNITIYRFLTIEGYKSNRFLKILNYLMFPLLGSIIALWIGRRYDLVFIYQTGPLTQAIPGIIIKKIYKKPVFIWTWDIWPDAVYAYGFKQSPALKLILDALVRFVYNNSQTIFISSPGFKEIIEKYTDKGKSIIYVPNWIPSYANLDEIKKKESKTFNFTFAGNIGKVQNLENVIHGFILAFGDSPDYQLHIIGDGSNLDNLIALVKLEKVHNIIFHGKKPVNEMHLFYAESDILIISLNQNPLFDLYIPSKFQSYLAVKKPILCCMHGIVKQMVKDSQVGLTADPADIKSIAKAFTQFSSFTEVEINLMKNKAQTLLDENFNRSKIITLLTKTIAHEK